MTVSEPTEAQVRPGAEKDLDALADLCHPYARETSITFDTTVLRSEERRSRLLSHPEDGPYRLMVAADADTQEILGYAICGPYRAKSEHRAAPR